MIQRTIKTIIDNIFDNVIKWCTITTLAEHSGRQISRHEMKVFF